MAILTISRELASGGRRIGQDIADTMGYLYVDKEMILEDIRAVGPNWEEWGRTLDLHCPTIWERYDWSFRGYAALLQCMVLQYALRDRVVLMGRGANFLLQDIPFAYRIRVVAPLEVRINRIMERESVNHDTARWMAQKSDQEREGFYLAIYGKQWGSPEEYDAVYNIGTQPLEEVIKSVKETLVGRDERKTEEAQELLRRRAIAAKVKAGLCVDPHLYVPTLEVHCDEQGLLIRGITKRQGQRKAIQAAAPKLAGGIPVRFDLHRRAE